MKKTTIKSHLKRYSIFQKRQTTINHAFASAMAPVDTYSEATIDRILNDLECLVNGIIMCVYCGISEAQTWDHLFALVKNNEPSGFGHLYGNLVPSCKNCNSKKGNKHWEEANQLINKSNPDQKKKVKRVIEKHLLEFKSKGTVISKEKKDKLDEVKRQILDLMRIADEIIKS